MKCIAIAMAVGSTFIASSIAFAQAPTWTVPAESARCPSKWGAGDQRGSGNLMKPQVVLDAVKQIKTGEIIDLSYELGPSMPFFGPRRFDMHLKRTFMNTGSNERGSNEEMVLSEIGQVGTQFDGFGHQSHRNSHYNCFKTEEITARNGFSKLGIENAPAFITRGVLIDVAGFKGVEMLGDNYEITVDDLQGALKKQNMTLKPGDAIIIHTGWGKLYGKDNPRYVKSCPGIGVKAAEWLISQRSGAARLRQLAGRSRAQSRSAAFAADPPARAGGERRAPVGKSQA